MRVQLHLLAFSAWLAATAIGLTVPTLQAEPLHPAPLSIDGTTAIESPALLRGTWPAS